MFTEKFPLTQMYELEQIEELFGEEALTYLNNKNRGGEINQKGNTYENFFTVYQLAKLSETVLEEGTVIQLMSQVLAFVDDLIIDYQSEAPLQHYQLKNAKTLSWGTGLRSIADDFHKQHQLNQRISRACELILVVSNQTLQVELGAAMPSILRPFSGVLHFPYYPNLFQVIEASPDFRAAIAYLSAFDDPEPDKVETVATVLLGAWVSSSREGVSVREILYKARQLNSSYIRSFSQDLQLDPEVEKILDRIKDFTYNLTKGFLHWQYRDGLTEGTLPYSIETEQFRRFQDLIKRQRPLTFEELESFLI